MIHPPSAWAFLGTVCKAAGCLVATAALADYATENRHLRAEVNRLAVLLDDYANANRELMAEAAAADVWIEAAREIVLRVEGEERVRMIEGGAL